MTPELLVCVLEAISESARAAHIALAGRLFRERVHERHELPNGYAFRFAAETYEDIATFVSHERKCCPFLTLEIRLTPHDGPVWLYMTGPDGVREFLASELPVVQTE